MRTTWTILVASLCVVVVQSTPVPKEDGLQSQALDQLVMAEAENDLAYRSKRTIGILRQLFPEISKDVNPESENRINELGGSETSNNEVRVQFADDTSTSSTTQTSEPGLALLDDEIEETTEAERSKRFFNFGFGASNGAGEGSGGGSGAGSGNFLFDIIRQAADGAARAAGTVYRVVAGTQSLGLGLSASRDVSTPSLLSPAAPSASSSSSSSFFFGENTPPAANGAVSPMPPLVAGSGGQASGGDAAGGVAVGAKQGDAAAEAVPGPVTRLLVIANRGISNLVQDLILRLAATSERIVNFKARLITSII